MDEKIIAIHEAGHAVVARVLCIPVDHVAMSRTDKESSTASARTVSASWLAKDADRPAQIQAAEKDAKVCLAGPLAQQKYQPLKLKHRIPAEWGDDFQLAKQFVAKAVLLETDETFNLPSQARKVILSHDASERVASRFDQISTDVRRLVAANWTAIERTAEELLRLRIISGDELDAIMHKCNSGHDNPLAN